MDPLKTDLALATVVRQLYPRALSLCIGGATFQRRILGRWSEDRERLQMALTAANVVRLRARGAVVIDVYGVASGRTFGACYSPASLLAEVPCAF
jgi:hypothetical protein